MEGALSGRAAPGRPVARPTLHCGPPAGASHPPKTPVSRLLPRPGVSSEWCPFATVKYFLRPLRTVRKRSGPFIFALFLIHTMSTECARLSARSWGYPPAYAQPRPQVTGCNLQTTIMGIALCNRPVFNCRRRLSAHLCYHRKPDRVTCAPLLRTPRSLGHLVRVARAGDAGAQVQELADPRLAGQKPGRPGQEGAVGAHPPAQPRGHGRHPMTTGAQSRLNSDGIVRLRGTGPGVSGWGLTPLR
jgi:hypothetical protein